VSGFGRRYNYPNFQEKGFLVAVDGIDNFPQTAGYTWVGAVVSPFPAAMYYSSGFKVASDLKVVHKLNYDSDAACPRWEDGWQWYDACDPDQHGYLCMIIDVRARLISTKEVGPKAKPVKVLNPRMVQIGFSILPIFTRGGQYTQAPSRPPARLPAPPHARTHTRWRARPAQTLPVAAPARDAT